MIKTDFYNAIQFNDRNEDYVIEAIFVQNRYRWKILIVIEMINPKLYVEDDSTTKPI